jgi:hypothetical protein
MLQHSVISTCLPCRLVLLILADCMLVLLLLVVLFNGRLSELAIHRRALS